MGEKILDTNILSQSSNDMTVYSIYVARCRAIPDARDGLKPVHRKILYALFNDFSKETRSKKTVKTAAVIGTVIRKYHPHGDAAVNSAIKPMTNWFESYKPMIAHQGGFGNLFGDSPSAPRYTEVMLSEYGLDCIIGDLKDSRRSADWQDTYDNTDKEPVFLPATVPNLLINGTFSIAVGLMCSVPKHNISEVIDATIKLMRNPKADIVLVPDDCCGCDIIDADFSKISKTGRGSFKVRANTEICEFNNHPAIHILTLPPMVYLNSIKQKIEKLVENNVLPQIYEVYDASSVDKKNVLFDKFDAYILLKKGCDPNYVRETLYSLTNLEKTVIVNFNVIHKDAPVLMGYKEYLNVFINFRRERKIRTYSNILMNARTKVHRMELYIKALESGEIDTIIKMIRKQKTMDDSSNIEYLANKLKVTPVQAKYILDTDLRKLSIAYLNYYKEQHKEALKVIKECNEYLVHPEKIDQIIIEELEEIKKKYGEPRRSRVISASEATGIPEGIFKIILTEKGIIKKIDQNEAVKAMKDDKVNIALKAENTDNILLFTRLGKVFKLPVHKIPFGKGVSGGIDMRIVLKKYTGEGICAVIPESALTGMEEEFKKTKKEALLFVLTRNGLFKSMRISELFGIPLGGLIYTKLNPDDIVVDIICMYPYNQMIIYSKNKLLRIQGTEAILLSRSAKGCIAMNSKNPIEGFICLHPKATDVVVITESGRVNRIPLQLIPLSKRGKAGVNGIKLNKTDSIATIHVCNTNDIIHVITMKSKYHIKVSDIQEGSSISIGSKLIDSSGIIHTSVS